MVQRKAPNKLGIQADHVKSNKRLADLITPSSPQHHDGMKNKGGPDLSKKMKKSRPIKRSSDMESLWSSTPLRKEIAQPGEPPTLRVPTTATASPHKQKQSPAILPEAVAPQKLSPGKGLEASPNYMKSTSSFEARKDRSSVSSRIPQTSVVHKTPSPKNSEKSKHSPASGHKASRPSNLTLVRTLTKTPSFKPSRASKKCSPVALCEDLDVQRATCSSTLKDSKFPHYLKLNHGGTELEGTSAMKVCPYTYCSLNGHHHAPLPPLKCFLSERRRMLKAQKSFKLGCLSPRRTRPSGDSMKKTDAGLAIFAEEPTIQETNLEDLSAIIPAPEGNKDFFIEIYTKDGEDGSAAAGRSKHLTDEKESATEKADGKIMESLLQESPCPEIDFCSFNQNSDAISIELNAGEFSPDYWMEEMEEETSGARSSQREIASPPRNLLDQPDSEAFEIECKEEECSASSSYDVLFLESAEPQDDVQEQIFHSDGTADNCIKEILDEEVLQGLYDEESVSSEAWLEDDSEHNVSYHDMEIDNNLVLSNNLNCDRLSPASDALEVPSTTEEEDGSNEPEDSQSTESPSDSIKDTTKAPKATSEDKNAVETNQIPVDLQQGDNVRDEMETGEVGATNSMMKIEPFDSSLGLTGADKNENHEENNLAANIEDSETNQTFTNGGPPNQMDDDSSDSNYAVVTPHNPHKEHEEAKMFRSPNSNHSDDHENSRMLRLSMNENNEQAVDSMEVECTNVYDGEKRCSTAESKSSTAPKNLLSRVSSSSNEEMLMTCTNLRITKSKRPDEELEDPREFNPREPNYLPLELDPEAEKVDLKHQMIDERKNAEEWMVDFALRQAVTNLAPARKKKVALLVEAFEKVTPVPKYQTHIRQTSRAFAHTRPMQACN